MPLPSTLKKVAYPVAPKPVASKFFAPASIPTSAVEYKTRSSGSLDYDALPQTFVLSSKEIEATHDMNHPIKPPRLVIESPRASLQEPLVAIASTSPSRHNPSSQLRRSSARSPRINMKRAVDSYNPNLAVIQTPRGGRDNASQSYSPSSSSSSPTFKNSGFSPTNSHNHYSPSNSGISPTNHHRSPSSNPYVPSFEHGSHFAPGSLVTATYTSEGHFKSRASAHPRSKTLPFQKGSPTPSIDEHPSRDAMLGSLMNSKRIAMDLESTPAQVRPVVMEITHGADFDLQHANTNQSRGYSHERYFQLARPSPKAQHGHPQMLGSPYNDVLQDTGPIEAGSPRSPHIGSLRNPPPAPLFIPDGHSPVSPTTLKWSGLQYTDSTYIQDKWLQDTVSPISRSPGISVESSSDRHF
jgi:hypothetical protein